MDGNQLTVDGMLQTPGTIFARMAIIDDATTILTFYLPLQSQVQGGYGVYLGEV